ncbi:MAG: prenyltransferase/squalene oxidase repeat-containing protein [Planctomycetota bacterium]|jgi:squalene-hopene/tetraprenyl-beta-curcumene cyclase
MTKQVLILLTTALVACGDQPPQAAPPAAGAAAPADVSAAIDKGVAWLRAQAMDGGIWMVKYQGREVPSVAHTALALTPIAAALPADRRKSDPMVQRAAGFILETQREDGAVDAQPSYFENYYTSCALMSLVVVDDPAHAPVREKMKAFLLGLQRREEGRAQGGIGYNKRQGADLSNAQFAIEALRAAGIPETHESMQRARAFLDRVQNRSENPVNKGVAYELEDETHGKVKVVPGNDGSAGYEPGVSKAGLQRLPDGTYIPRGYGSMTYALLKCYLLTGLPFDDERVQAAVRWLADHYTWDENPGFRVVVEETGRTDAPYWGLYYYYMTAAKALRLAGIEKLETPDGARDWRVDLAAALLKRQRADGSWLNDQSRRWEEADPVITTAYALITLQEIQGSR